MVYKFTLPAEQIRFDELRQQLMKMYGKVICIFDPHMGKHTIEVTMSATNVSIYELVEKETHLH